MRFFFCRLGWKEYEGNRRFAEIIDSYRSQYVHASRFEKGEICKKVVQIVKESGGRFLKRGGGGSAGDDEKSNVSPSSPENSHTSLYWIEVDDSIAIGKVGHSFRTKTTRQKPLEPTSFFSLIWPNADKESLGDDSDSRSNENGLSDDNGTTDMVKRLKL